MLRAVARLYTEGPALELVRRDVCKGFRTVAANSAAASQIVLSSSGAPPTPSVSATAPPAVPPPPPPPPPPRRGAWTLAAALALSASIGGVYLYKKNKDEEPQPPSAKQEAEAARAPYPSAEGFPERVEYLIAGGGTAAFAALRAIRAARPTARVLLVTDEHALPYMRPPLSKEIWAEPPETLSAATTNPDKITFRQWNGKRRALSYEPPAFYTPVERLATREGGGVAVARGWAVRRVGENTAELTADGQPNVQIGYDKCLIATGVKARRVPELRRAAAAGKSVALRSVEDVAALAAALDKPDISRVLVVGGGFLACELSAALADRLRASGARVVQVYREQTCMAHVLPAYLANDAARRLQERGVTLMPETTVRDADIDGQRVALRLHNDTAGPSQLSADVVVECCGSEVDAHLAHASRLETCEQRGGVLVNAELAAANDVYAAGDVACFYDPLLGRRRVEHHDNAVVSGRLAGENMAAVAPAKKYKHQSMFWSDLGPHLGYEAIGIIDSSLPTVGVFAEEDVSASETESVVAARASESAAPAPERNGDSSTAAEESETAIALSRPPATKPESARYERGVVFYLRDSRIVGILLWNMFNRMHVARQVLSVGHFEDLLEVGKLFALQPSDGDE